MTAVEMQHSFDRKGGLEIDTYTVQKLLNQAQNIFIDTYAPHFDMSETARKKLAVLVKNYNVAPSATGADNISTNAQFVALPSDLRKALQEHVLDNSTFVKVKPIKYDEYNANLNNPFKEPPMDIL